ncbi:hypothetical Protein YC6258_00476 [Gynuella sunshinyii YC6258]|uniref:Uncharacterized protein n=1 Tax=Gynuella sunshinyii YC6258 TaxID=1445510 RepID=A0A0C5VE87_9GAMM|nr:hypothetical Protein YC6258_00476 [Gynuella sunshinyii YC6258]
MNVLSDTVGTSGLMERDARRVYRTRAAASDHIQYCYSKLCASLF